MLYTRIDMSNKLAKQSKSFNVRPGEGAVVDAIIKQTPGEDRVTSFQIDISNAPVPQKRYVADVCMVDYSNEQVKIYFGQKKIGSQKLRSMLEVSMAPNAVSQFLDSVQADERDGDEPGQGDRFAQLGRRMGLKPEPLATIQEEPEQTAAFAVNMLLFAMSGRECVFDFYHASAFSVGAVVHTRKFSLDPVVRVDIRSTLALSMIAELSKLEGRFPEDVVKRVRT